MVLDHISKFREGSSMEVGGRAAAAAIVVLVFLLLLYINYSPCPHWDLLQVIRKHRSAEYVHSSRQSFSVLLKSIDILV